jgi:hypothetical protein
MRYQKAKRIIDILPLLNSPDRESVLLGIAMLKNEPLFANLNKHYVYVIKRIEWPGFSSECPEKFKNVSKVSCTFSKKLLSDIFYIEDEVLFNINVLCILCWIYKYCGWRSKSKSLDKYKWVHSDRVQTNKITRNKNYSPLFEKYFYDYSISEHGRDRSYLSKSNKLDIIKRRTKKPWQDNRKYNTRHPMNYKEFVKYFDKFSYTVSTSQIV